MVHYLEEYLSEHPYIDYFKTNIQECMSVLFTGAQNDLEKAKAAYLYVRDEIPHSFDCKATVITAKASDVLLHRTGICHAKANLLAALLRPQGIPVGFRFQHITLLDDDSMGYCVHCYNAIYLENRWIEVDARGNTNGINAQFSTEEPVLAFPNRPQYDEFVWKGVFAVPHSKTMRMLEASKTIQDVMKKLPDDIGDMKIE